MALTLYADSSWQSPWVFHAMVALEELRVPYKLEPHPMPLPAEVRADLQARALLGKIPCVVDDDFALTESSAISEYLAERFPPPAHPRLLPADGRERARARQVMSWLRTSLFALREERPTSHVFQRPSQRAMTERARADVAELVRVAEAVVPAGRTTIASEWSVADADLALALMRLVATGDAVPKRLVDYALAQWGRESIRRFLAFIPTTP